MAQLGGQSQTGGDGSQQIQVSGDLVLGVTEERAREIAEQTAVAVVAQYSSEARAEASARVESFESSALPALANEDLLGAFADPAFQVFLRQVQEQAVSTADEEDHELLTRLLIERARKDTKRIRLAITRGVAIIDQLDHDALRGLTLTWIVRSLHAPAPTIERCTDMLEKLLEPLLIDGLPPDGYRWIDDLDVLDCVRVIPAGGATLKRAIDILAHPLTGVFSEGFTEEGLAEAQELWSGIVQQTGREYPGQFFVEHDLIPGRYRLPFGSDRAWDEWIERAALQEHSTDLDRIQTLGRLKTVSPAATAAATQYLKENRPAIFAAHEYWDGVPTPFSMTVVGQALAFSNLKRWNPLEGLGDLETFLGA